MRMNAKKKEKTRRETTAIKVWVTPAEKAAITVKADLCEKAWWRNFCSLPWARNEPLF